MSLGIVVTVADLEARPEFAGDLALENVAEHVVLNRRVGQVGNLQHEHILPAATPAYTRAGVDHGVSLGGTSVGARRSQYCS